MSTFIPRKGKRPADRQYHHHDEPDLSTTPSKAFVQAYEAQLIYGRNELASELATRAEDLPESSRSRGRGLLSWNASDEERAFWADRHDIIHLLTDLPSSVGQPRSRDSSHSFGSSWDSLPSDAEETFHITSTEQLEDYERKKKQAWITALREDRLRERAEEDRVQAIADGHLLSADSWDPDEQPSEGIMTLMRHTARSLSESSDPRVLEMRILANYAKDERFAFLRGRYNAIWTGIKDHVRRVKMEDPARKKKEEKAVGALLGGYDSSDEEDGDETDQGGDPVGPPASPPPPSPPMKDSPRASTPLSVGESASIDTIHQPDGQDSAEAEAEKQKERRRRAEEWKRQRAEAKSAV